MIDDMREIEIVVAHSERVTLRIGDVFLKIDTDQARIDREVEVMARAPISTPEVLWRKPPVLALAAVPERRSACSKSLRVRLRRRGLRRVPPSARCTTLRCRRGPAASVSNSPFSAVGARSSFRQCSTRSVSGSSPTMSFPPDVVRRNRQVAEAALRPWTPVFIHGALQIVHLFVDSDEVSGVVDWSEGGQGDAMYDLATLTLAHEEHLIENRRDSRVLVAA